MTKGGSRAFWIFIALLALGHFLLHLGLGIGGLAPDLLTVAVLLGARRLSGVAAALLGFGLGLLSDALSLFAFGANAVVFTVLGFLGARSRDLFIGESLVFVAIYLFVGKWLHDALYYVLTLANGGESDLIMLVVDAPIAALYAAGVGVGAFVLFRALTGER